MSITNKYLKLYFLSCNYILTKHFEMFCCLKCVLKPNLFNFRFYLRISSEKKDCRPNFYLNV